MRFDKVVANVKRVQFFAPQCSTMVNILPKYQLQSLTCSREVGVNYSRFFCVTMALRALWLSTGIVMYHAVENCADIVSRFSPEVTRATIVCIVSAPCDTSFKVRRIEISLLTCLFAASVAFLVLLLQLVQLLEQYSHWLLAGGVGATAKGQHKQLQVSVDCYRLQVCFLVHEDTSSSYRSVDLTASGFDLAWFSSLSSVFMVLYRY